MRYVLVRNMSLMVVVAITRGLPSYHLKFVDFRSYSMSMDSFSDNLVSNYHPLPISHGGVQSASILDDELAQIGLVVFQEKQIGLITLLRVRTQNPPSGSFCMEDLVWTDHLTRGKEKSKSSKLAINFGTDWTTIL